MTKKITYEENPWDDVKNHKIEDFKQVNNLLPSAQELKKVDVVIDGNQVLLIHLSPKDIKSLQNIAKKGGVSSPDLAASVLHEFVTNSPTV